MPQTESNPTGRTNTEKKSRQDAIFFCFNADRSRCILLHYPEDNSFRPILVDIANGLRDQTTPQDVAKTIFTPESILIAYPAVTMILARMDSLSEFHTIAVIAEEETAIPPEKADTLRWKTIDDVRAMFRKEDREKTYTTLPLEFLFNETLHAALTMMKAE